MNRYAAEAENAKQWARIRQLVKMPHERGRAPTAVA